MFGRDAPYALAGMTFPGAGQCLNCRRYNGNQRCDAFPSGIPEAVFDDAISHTVALPGDHGLRYEEVTTPSLAELVAAGRAAMNEEAE